MLILTLNVSMIIIINILKNIVKNIINCIFRFKDKIKIIIIVANFIIIYLTLIGFKPIYP